eukprot:924155-Rhodomonas_salina.1
MRRAISLSRAGTTHQTSVFLLRALVVLLCTWQPARSTPAVASSRPVRSTRLQAHTSTAPPKALPEVLPQYRYDTRLKHWFPVEEEAGHLMMIEKSRTARANCRFCGSKIDRGVLRAGFPIQVRGTVP